MREFQDKVNWEMISYHQKLSKDFIREFKDKIRWDAFASNENYSIDFVKLHRNSFNLDFLLGRRKITEEQYYELKYPPTVTRFELLDLT